MLPNAQMIWDASNVDFLRRFGAWHKQHFCFPSIPVALAVYALGALDETICVNVPGCVYKLCKNRCQFTEMGADCFWITTPSPAPQLTVAG